MKIKFAAALIVLVCSGDVFASQLAQEKLKLSAMAAGELNKLQVEIESVLRSRADGKLSYFKDQTFEIQHGDRTFSLIPVGYLPQTKTQNGLRYRCAVGIRNGKDGSLTVTDVIGVGNFEAVTCSKPVAVGTLTFADKRAGLIAIFDSSSPNASVKSPVVFSFNDQGNLILDFEKTDDIDSAGKGTSVSGARKYFANRK